MSYRRYQSLSLSLWGVEVSLAVSLALAIPAAARGAAEIPFHLQLKYEEGRKLLDNQRWPEAAIVLRRIMEDAPSYAPAAIDLSRALVYSGRREEALSVLATAAERENNDRSATRREVLVRRARVMSRAFVSAEVFQIHQEGINLLQAKKYSAAKERFRQALAREHDNVEILQRIGQCELIDGDADSAAERLRLAKKLNPWEPEVRLWLGRALQLRGEISSAVLELQDAHAGLPHSELAAVWLADALAASGARGQVIPLLEKHVKTNPLHVQALLALARQRYLQDPQALRLIRRDLQLAMSRIELYPVERTPTFEGDLGVDLRDPPTLKSEIEALLQRVEARQLPDVEPSAEPEA